MHTHTHRPRQGPTTSSTYSHCLELKPWICTMPKQHRQMPAQTGCHFCEVKLLSENRSIKWPTVSESTWSSCRMCMPNPSHISSKQNLAWIHLATSCGLASGLDHCGHVALHCSNPGAESQPSLVTGLAKRQMEVHVAPNGIILHLILLVLTDTINSTEFSVSYRAPVGHPKATASLIQGARRHICRM